VDYQKVKGYETLLLEDFHDLKVSYEKRLLKTAASSSTVLMSRSL